jgi:hypothetical protein
VTNKNRKRRPPPSGYRRPQPTVEQPARRGFLDSILPARAPGVASPMPRLRTSFARGFVLTISTPVLLVGVPTFLLVAWLILVATGYQGPFSVMATTFAIPPVGTLADSVWLVPTMWRGSPVGSLSIVFGLAAIRALLLSAVTTVAVERCRTGAVSGWAVRRLGRVFPYELLVSLLLISVLIAGQLPASLLGPGIGLLVFFALIVGGVYLLGSVAAIAADEDRTLTDTFRRSVQVGRLPGSGTLVLGTLYVFGSAAVVLGRPPGSEIGVNPSLVAWLLAIGLNLVSVAVAATFAFRYLSVAALVDDPPVRSRAPAPGRSGRSSRR